jgi:hypothetical protein
MDPKTVESLGIEDFGKWMPFIFHLDIVEAAKLTSEDKDHPTCGCTTLFTRNGESFIIDTPCEEFFKIFKEFIMESFIDDTSLDLEL